MKLLFFGTSEFAVPSLEAVAAEHDVAGVVTQPDRPAGRGHKPTATPVKRAALARGLRVFEPEKLRAFTEDARALGADAFVVASYGKIVPQVLLDVVPIAFNVHPSLLPLYRGATPIQSAIRDGRAETGVTIMAMDAGMDTGDVLFQERTAIGPQETYGELHDRLARQSAMLLARGLASYAAGAYERIPQNELARRDGISDDEIAATATRPLRKGDLDVDWLRSPDEIVALVRSLAPAPLARATYAEDAIKIVAARAVSLAQLAAEMQDGKLWQTPGLNISAWPGSEVLYALHDPANPDGAVIVDRLIAPNRGPCSGADYVRRRVAVARSRMESGHYP
ncbi:MAG TPA: methionyl-tRNA formyltransferase [Candidatus Elarobacter sp.]|nr:methionyl-tRNA formyltransferase [Candidatus Elarobacter sp.]